MRLPLRSDELVDDHGGWSYVTVVAEAPHLLAVRLNAESEALRWVLVWGALGLAFDAFVASRGGAPDHPASRRVRDYLAGSALPLVRSGVTRFGEQIVDGAIVDSADGSIDELLAGTGDVVYSVTLKGDTQNAYTQITGLPWVSGIKASQADGQTNWQVSVTDEAAAKDQLMSLLVSSGLKVFNFSRQEQNLEDVFINIIERSQK